MNYHMNRDVMSVIFIVFFFFAMLTLTVTCLTHDVEDNEIKACKAQCRSLSLMALATTERTCICGGRGQMREIPLKEIK